MTTIIVRDESACPAGVQRALASDLLLGNGGSMNRCSAGDRRSEFYKQERNIATASSEQVRQLIFRQGLFHWRNYEPHLGALRDNLDDALICYRD